jgi:hypothetical protein
MTFEDIGRYECVKERIIAWRVQWDEVRVEAALGPTIADLLLLYRGVPVGIIEICATHAVEEYKAQVLCLIGIPWIEVKADAALYDETAPWTPAKPLQLLRAGTDPPWICGKCGWFIDRCRPFKVEAFKILDVYCTQGAWLREVVVVKASRVDNFVQSVWLESYNGTKVADCLPSPDGPRQRTAEYDSLLQACEALHRANIAVLDSPSGWQFDRNPKSAFVHELFPPRLKWEPLLGQWISHQPAGTV